MTRLKPFLDRLMILLLFLGGMVLLSYGLFLIYRPLAWLFGGGFAIAYALFLSKPEGTQPR